MTKNWQCYQCSTINRAEIETCSSCNLYIPLKTRQHFDLAHSYKENNDLKNALYRCQLACLITAYWAEPHNLRGIILEKMGKYTKAIAAYHQAVQLDPTHQNAKDNLREAEAKLQEQEQSPTAKATVDTEIHVWLIMGSDS